MQGLNNIKIQGRSPTLIFLQLQENMKINLGIIDHFTSNGINNCYGKNSFTIDKVYKAVILNNKKIEDSDNHRK